MLFFNFAVYHTRAIISRSLHLLTIFHCGLYCRAVSITDNLWTKTGNSSIFEPKTCGFIIKRGFKSRTGYNGARMVHGISLTVPMVLTNLFKGIEAIDNKIKSETEDNFIF